jgi:hypothetical protein
MCVARSRSGSEYWDGVEMRSAGGAAATRNWDMRLFRLQQEVG